MIESNDQEWGLCDHDLVAPALDVEAGYGDEDDESPMEHLAHMAADIEAGLAEVPRGWKLDRSEPDILVWTTPSGRRYASTLTGEWLPVPTVGP